MNLNCFSLNAVFIFLIIFLGSDQHHLSAETTTAEKAMVVNFGFGYCQRISFIRFDLMNVSEPGGGSATPQEIEMIIVQGGSITPGVRERKQEEWKTGLFKSRKGEMG